MDATSAAPRAKVAESTEAGAPRQSTLFGFCPESRSIVAFDIDQRSAAVCHAQLAETQSPSRRKIRGLEPFELAKLLGEPMLQIVRRAGWVSMGAAHGLGHDIINDAKRQVVASGELQRTSCVSIRRLVGFFPKNGGAAFRADHGIPRMLQHADAICDVSTDAPLRLT